ncbi:hypothetical protein ACQFX9_15545 [Aliinostoc sp. HNIBRCY26]
MLDCLLLMLLIMPFIGTGASPLCLPSPFYQWSWCWWGRSLELS